MDDGAEVYRFEVERVEVKLAYLQLLDLSTDDLLKFLKVDLSKAVPGLGKLCCPKCNVGPKEGALIVIHKDFTKDSPLLRKIQARDGKEVKALTTDYYVCECGCVYKFYTGHKRNVRKTGPSKPK